MNVLLTIYDFPPFITGGSVVRTLKHIKYLKSKDVKFYVIAVRRDHLPRNEIYKDLLKDVIVLYIPDPIRNLFDKVKEGSNQRIRNNTGYSTIMNRGKYLLKWVLNNFLFPDLGYFWYRKAFQSGINLIEERSIDVIYSTFPEPSAHWLGFKLSRKMKLPLILDYRDLWSTNPLFRKNWIFNNYLRFTEKKILKCADSVIFATEMAQEKYCQVNYIKHGRYELIWNGYDPEDFSDFSSTGNSILDKSAINYTYTGNVGDFLSHRRNPKALLDAFGEFYKSNPNVKLNFVGNLPHDVRRYIEITDGIEYFPAVPYPEIPRILLDSDILIVLLTKWEDITAVPGKIYEYMASGKFILGLTEQNSQVSEIIRTYNYGLVGKPDAKDAILKQLEVSSQIVMKEDNSKPKVNYQFVENFSRRKSADKLYQILQKVVSRN